MCTDAKIQKITMYVKKLFEAEATGHDFYHMQRVAGLAKAIAEKENADLFITVASAYLHDVGDHKLFIHPDDAIADMNQFLQSIGVEQERIKLINQIIKEISYSKGVRIPQSLEAKIVQDADKLDAIGAIGIARTFAYGGAKGQAIYDTDSPDNTSFQHFYDKLFHLKNMLHTAYAKKLGEDRNQFLKNFAKQFMYEWDHS